MNTCESPTMLHLPDTAGLSSGGGLAADTGADNVIFSGSVPLAIELWGSATRRVTGSGAAGVAVVEPGAGALGSGWAVALAGASVPVVVCGVPLALAPWLLVASASAISAMRTAERLASGGMRRGFTVGEGYPSVSFSQPAAAVTSTMSI